MLTVVGEPGYTAQELADAFGAAAPPRCSA
jgi:hypothetical protein